MFRHKWIVKKQVLGICSFIYLLLFVALYICCYSYYIFREFILFLRLNEVKFNSFRWIQINQSFKWKYSISRESLFSQINSDNIKLIYEHYPILKSTQILPFVSQVPGMKLKDIRLRLEAISQLPKKCFIVEIMFLYLPTSSNNFSVVICAVLI